MPKVHGHDISRPAKPVARNFLPSGGEPYKVKTGDSWTSLARARGMDPWVLIRFNYPGLPPDLKQASREVNWYLQEYVGCDDTTGDHHNYVFTSSAKPGFIHLPRQPVPVVPQQPPPPNYTRSRVVVPYIYQEMVTHANGPEVAKMADQMSGKTARDAFPRTGEPGENAARGGMVLAQSYFALDTFRSLVRTNGPWDHKPILRKMLQLSPPSDMHFPIEGDADHEYYYDIWSNIHYGYVGSAIGIPGSWLQKGAAGGGLAGRNDPMDVETVQIGIDLWKRFGARMTLKQFHDEILARSAKMLQIQASADYRAAVGSNFNHIEPITDGK